MPLAFLMVVTLTPWRWAISHSVSPRPTLYFLLRLEALATPLLLEEELFEEEVVVDLAIWIRGTSLESR